TVSPGAMALMASRVHSPRARAPLAPRAASRATASRLWVWAWVLFMGLVLWVGVPVAEGRRGPGGPGVAAGPPAGGARPGAWHCQFSGSCTAPSTSALAWSKVGTWG